MTNTQVIVGPSALVDPFGRVRARTPGLERAAAVGEIWARQDLTPYARFGDAFAFGCVAVVVLACAVAHRRAPGAENGG